MKKLSKGKLENRQCNYNDIPQYKFQILEIIGFGFRVDS